MNQATSKITVPFGDLKRRYQALKGEIDETVARVLESGWYILGEELAKFESHYAKYLHTSQAIGVGSGTEALHLALVACGVQSGDEVITVTNTAVPTISAITFANAMPVFVDIDPKSFCMNAGKIEEKITSRTKAIIPVHLYGQACDMPAIMAVAEKHGLRIIEDACQAHGAEFAGKKAGTFGDYGCFSFYPSKNLGAFGDGGIVVTNDQQKAEQIRLLRNYGQTKRYYHQTKGFNSRLDDMQAALLAVQLPHLEAWNKRRREVAAIYTKHVRNKKIVVPSTHKDAFHVFHLYVIRCTERDRLREYLAEKGIGTQIHYPIPCHLQEAYKDLRLGKGTCPAAERCAEEILSLPIYPELTDEEALYVSEIINQFD
jgi:dTDP-4-amino-4,6-dideoxygalactose transaminase